MSDSLIQKDNDYCFIHKKYLNVYVPAQQEHHCLHGSANRRLADQDGLTVRLCCGCHMALHDKGLYDLQLQKEAQQAWMDYYHKSVEDFIKRYGKSYL